LNLVFTVALLFLFKPGYKQGALGVANSLSAAVNTGLLVFALRKKLGRLEFGPLRSSLPSLLAAGALAGLTAWVTARLWGDHPGPSGLWPKVAAVFVPASAATMIYWITAWWLRVPSAREIGGLLLKRFGQRK